MTPLKYLTVFSIIVPILLFGQEKDGKNKFKPIFSIGLQTQMGYAYRNLKSTSEFSKTVIDLRNQNESGFYTSRGEFVINICNQRNKWLEYQLGLGYEYLSPTGLQEYFFSPPHTNGKTVKQIHNFLHFRNGLNFLIGNNSEKLILSGGASLSIYVRKKYASNERENSKNVNVSPYVSVGYQHQFLNKNSFSIQAYFNSQILDNNETHRYTEITGYSGPTGSGQNTYPEFEYHAPEEEYYWQAGLKLTFLFNLKNNRN